MKKQHYTFATRVVLLIAVMFGCNQNDDQPKPYSTGLLSVNVSLLIESEAASGRTSTGDPIEFYIAIYDVNDALVISYDRLADAPTEIELITGEYYVVAHSDNELLAAFDNPYYYGRSENFTIDKEEVKTIDIVAQLANCKVSINYSDQVKNTFQSYTALVEVTSYGETLNYGQGETREGYFVTEPLSIQVDLAYTKIDGTLIERTFTASIDDPQPKTLYKVNVDAGLVDGKIIFNLIVDESYTEETISVGDNSNTFSLSYGWTSYITFRHGTLGVDGGYLLVGRNYWGFHMIKVDYNGTKLWEKEYSGLGLDECTGVETTLDGGYILVGNNSNSQTSWVAKIDQSGNLLWDESFDIKIGGVAQRSVDFRINANNEIYIPGSKRELSEYKPYVLKLNEHGDLIWEKVFTELDIIEFTELELTDDGGFIATGGDDFHFAKIDASGNVEWQTSYGGTSNDQVLSLIKGNGGYYASGISGSDDGDVSNQKGQSDAWIVKIDDFGNLVWEKTLGGTEFDILTDLSLSSNGDLLMTGITFSTDLDMSNNSIARNMWVCRMNPSGQLVSLNFHYVEGDSYWIDEDPYGFIMVGSMNIDSSTRYDIFQLFRLNPDGTL
ncbi:DUF4493 domain-containing protein [Ekhidna sp. MALMAid0563]|uniref:DUF4493 domain-containing protein n=1 Tax=Ekhidna sp. MALMAid0563 TaxID=3143937 RepID=UPI0032E03FA9